MKNLVKVSSTRVAPGGEDAIVGAWPWMASAGYHRRDKWIHQVNQLSSATSKAYINWHRFPVRWDSGHTNPRFNGCSLHLGRRSRSVLEPTRPSLTQGQCLIICHRWSLIFGDTDINSRSDDIDVTNRTIQRTTVHPMWKRY